MFSVLIIWSRFNRSLNKMNEETAHRLGYK
jgi:hypothetical protein